MAQRTYTSLPFIEKPVAAGNFGRSGRLPIKTIVFHTTDGTLPGTLAWFNNPKSGVSSNYVLDTNGQLYAMLEEFYVPYTNGDLTSNRQSVTIEVVDNSDPNGPRSDELYRAAALLARDLCTFYGLPINRETIKGHREVSSSHPQCPGNLDLDRIAREAGGNSTPEGTIPVEKATFEQLVTKATAYDAFAGAGYRKIDDVLARLKQASEENTGLKQQISQCEQASAALSEELRKKHEEDATAIDTGLTAQQERDELEGDLQHIRAVLGLPEEAGLTTIVDTIHGLQVPNDQVVKEYGRLGKALEEFFDKSVEPAKGIWQRLLDRFRGGEK